MDTAILNMADISALVVLGLVALYAVVDGFAPTHAEALRLRPLFRL